MMNSAPIVWLKGDATSAARVGRSGDALVIEWPEFLRLTVSATYSVDIEPLSEIDPDVLSKMSRFARAVPQYLQGATVFHAASIAIDGRALLILGEKGAGKSTAAALACRAGASLLSDDTVVGTFDGDTFVLHPLEDAHWLDPRSRREVLNASDSYEDKRPVIAPRIQRSPVRLTAAVVLAVHTKDCVEVTKQHGAASAMRLLDAALRIPLDPERSRYDFNAIARIARGIPVYSMLRGERFSATFTADLLNLVRAP